jgi:hypothetical protein
VRSSAWTIMAGAATWAASPLFTGAHPTPFALAWTRDDLQGAGVSTDIKGTCKPFLTVC